MAAAIKAIKYILRDRLYRYNNIMDCIYYILLYEFYIYNYLSFKILKLKII